MRRFTFLIVAWTVFALAGAALSPCRADDAPPAADAKKDKSSDAAAPKGEGGADSAKKKAPADISGGHFAGDPVFVHLSPIVLPILGDTGPEQLVTVTIAIQVKDFDTADDMTTNMPKVMDALIQVLYGGLSNGSLRDGRLVNPGKIKNQAMLAIQNLEGAENIKDVLIVNMSQRLL